MRPDQGKSEIEIGFIDELPVEIIQSLENTG